MCVSVNAWRSDVAILEHQGVRPKIDPTARIAPTAVICGDVSVGPNTSIGFGAVVVAESGPVEIGANCVIMDTAVLRGLKHSKLMLRNNVLVGPRAYLTGCTIEEDVFLATGCSVFNGAVIGRKSEVRINGIVHLKTRLPEGSMVPLNWIAVGDPAVILPPEDHEKIWAILRPLNFPHYVFGVERPAEGETIMPTVLPRYAAALRRLHADDAEVARARSSV
jgi:carbonic anhydrase/acetyltransferase-like protein (isoleucine patch superfamily)